MEALAVQQLPQPVSVAVKVAGLPTIEEPEAVAVSELVPRAGPSLQLTTAATPLAFVVTLLVPPRPMLPPPEATANVTGTFATGFPLLSVTSTAGGTATVVLTAAC